MYTDCLVVPSLAIDDFTYYSLSEDLAVRVANLPIVLAKYTVKCYEIAVTSMAPRSG